MSAARTPKVGEVWTEPPESPDERPGRWELLSERADRRGKRAWLDREHGNIWLLDDDESRSFRPPVTPIPDYMPSEVWVSAHPGYRGGTAHSSDANALYMPDIVGAVRYVRDDKTGMVTR